MTQNSVKAVIQLWAFLPLFKLLNHGDFGEHERPQMLKTPQ